MSTLRIGIILGSCVLVSAAAVAVGCSNSDDSGAPLHGTGTSGGTSSGGTSSGGTSSGGTSGGPQFRTALAAVKPFALAGGTTQGNATFTERDGGVELKLTVQNAVTGARGVHVHVGGSCDTDPGGHFNPDPNTLNGQWDNIQVDDAGTGTLTSFRLGLTLDPAADGGAGIVNRTLVVHAAPTPATTDAGAPPPKSGCGVITSK